MFWRPVIASVSEAILDYIKSIASLELLMTLCSLSVSVHGVDGNAHFCSIFDEKANTQIKAARHPGETIVLNHYCPDSCQGVRRHAAHHSHLCCAFSANFSSNLKQNWTFCVCIFNPVNAYPSPVLKFLSPLTPRPSPPSTEEREE